MIALVAAGLLGPAATAAAQTTATTAYPYRDGNVPIVLHLDTLAVAAAPGVAFTELLAAVQPLGLTFVRVTAAGLPLFAMTPRPRDEVWQLARAVAEAAPTVVRHAGFAVRRPGAPDPVMVSNRFVVRFGAGAPLMAVDSLNAAYRVAQYRETLRAGEVVLEATARSPADPLELAAAYAASPLVQLAEPDFVGAIVSTGVAAAADPLAGSQWHLQKIRAPDAWTVTSGSPSVIIAVVEEFAAEDTHPDLKVLGTWDAVSGTAIFPTSDNRRHATAVAGLAAAPANGIGVTGVCPACGLLLVRGGSVDEGSYMADAVRWAAANGAWVINNSWSVVMPFGTLEDAIKEAAQTGRGGKGIVIVQSMVNSAPASDPKDQDRCEGFPVNLDLTLAVASSTDQDVRGKNSSTGACLDLLAPGAGTHTTGQFAGSQSYWGVTSTDLPGTAGYNPGTGPTSAAEATCPFLPDFSDDAYTKCFGGSSAAAPIVAGVAGLVLSVDPALTGDEVMDILRRTADKIEYDDAGTPADCGDDPPNANVAGYENPSLTAPCPLVGLAWSFTHGYGRVNAFAAVQAASGETLPVPTTNGGSVVNPTTPEPPGPVVGAVGIVGVIVVLGGGLWWLVCCRRVARLERKLAALHEHYGGALPHVIRCIDQACPNTGGQDPDWPPPDVPGWP